MLSRPPGAASGFTITCAFAMRMAPRASVARTFIGMIFHRALDRHWRDRPIPVQTYLSLPPSEAISDHAGGLARALCCSPRVGGHDRSRSGSCARIRGAGTAPTGDHRR